MSESRTGRDGRRVRGRRSRAVRWATASAIPMPVQPAHRRCRHRQRRSSDHEGTPQASQTFPLAPSQSREGWLRTVPPTDRLHPQRVLGSPRRQVLPLSADPPREGSLAAPISTVVTAGSRRAVRYVRNPDPLEIALTWGGLESRRQARSPPVKYRMDGDGLVRSVSLGTRIRRFRRLRGTG